MRRSAAPACRALRLFPAEELCLRATGTARLSALAARAPRPDARTRASSEDQRTIARLRELGAELAREFGLRYTALDAEREGVTAHYGICYEDGRIRIRLRHAVTGRLLRESSLVDTLCHELAHLRHMNHGLRFRRLYRRILDRARERGFYRPRTPGAGRPAQPGLFEPRVCSASRSRG